MAVISKSILADAKAFLCWETFNNLSIQLVPLRNEVAFYYPPSLTMHSVVLFYQAEQENFFEPLCLLFHEAGHKQQYEKAAAEFERKMAIPVGAERQLFERQAWQFARDLFEKFIDSHGLNRELLHDLEAFAEIAIESYAEHV